MREPLVAPLAAIATGILASRYVSFEPAEILTFLAAFFLLCLLSLWRGMRVAAMVCCLASFWLAGLLAAWVHRPALPPELDAGGSRETVLFEGCVVEPPVLFEEREQFTLELEPGARARVNMYLRDGDEPPRLEYGQKIEIEGRVRRPRNFENPGAFDYTHYLARQNIYWMISARAATPPRVLDGRCGSKFQAFIYKLRTGALDRLDRLYAGRPYEAAMMKALLIGDTARLEKVWTDEYRSTGTVHALVISGSHVAVLSGLFLFLLRRVFLLHPTLAGLLTAALCWLYALVTGGQAPVVRSAAGLTFFLIGRYLFRRSRALNILAAVAMGFLVFDPEQLFEASFQLSFLAVAFLGAIADPIVGRTTRPMRMAAHDLHRKVFDLRTTPRAAQFRVELRLLAEAMSMWMRLPERAAQRLVAPAARWTLGFFELILTSAVIQIGLALPMLLYFHRVSVTGLSANAVVVPALGLVVPLGFAAITTGWTPLADAAGALLAISRATVQLHAAWEPKWRVPSPPLWLDVALTLALVACAFAMASESRWRRAVAVTAVLVLLGVALWHPFAPQLKPAWLEMTVVDVGQGDGIFLAFPDGRLMLVDGGGIAPFGRRAPPRLDIGEDVISPYLWTRSIRKIDVVALTHAHHDHMGGLGAILDNFQVGELWTGAVPPGDAWNALREKARKKGIKIRSLLRGETSQWGGASVEVLAPSPEYQPRATAGNNDSLVLRIRYGQRSFLLAGDMERAVEADLVREGLASHVDVLKVAHHGSKTSSTEDLLESVRPEFAVVSAGFENSYGHPHPSVVERLREKRASVLRTDVLGLITIRTDGRRLEVDTEKWMPHAGTERLPAFEH